MNSGKVASFLEDVRDHRGGLHAIVERLREIALNSGPAITEEVKYGGLLFSSGSSFCGVFAYRTHVTIEFGRGASLPDPHGVLEGNGKQRRHIKIRELADIESRKAAAYIAIARAAVDS